MMKTNLLLRQYFLCVALIIIYSVLCTFQVHSQTVVQSWVQEYNGTGNGYDQINATAVDPFGNVYVTGESDGSGTGRDYVTIKYNSSGVMQWTQRYDGGGNDRANALFVDLSGNVYVTGGSNGSSQSDFTTIKYNSAGTMVWTSSYHGSIPALGLSGANAIKVDASGNVYITGTITGNGTSHDYATIKYNSAGVQQWAALYNGPANSIDNALGLAIDAMGNVIVTGTSSDNDPNSLEGSWEYATVKYNSSGSQQWVQRYLGPGRGNDGANAIAVDLAGNIFVTGYSEGIGTARDYATIKYDPSGVKIWEARYDGPGNQEDKPSSIVLDIQGNIYITGFSTGNGTSLDYATIKYNPDGTQAWIARYDGPVSGLDVAKALAIDLVGNVYVTGSSQGTGTFESDIATIKYSSSGVPQWVARYNGPAQSNASGTSMAISVPSRLRFIGSILALTTSVIVGGYITPPGEFQALDYLTIKYNQELQFNIFPTVLGQAAKEPRGELEKTLASFPLTYRFTCTPNPAKDISQVHFELPVTSRVSIKLYDASGREFATIIDDIKKAGYYTVDYFTNRLASGIYYYKMVATDGTNQFVQNQKMVVIK
jgi:uncharacterized delta-60 repeat protein